MIKLGKVSIETKGSGITTPVEEFVTFTKYTM